MRAWIVLMLATAMFAGCATEPAETTQEYVPDDGATPDAFVDDKPAATNSTPGGGTVGETEDNRAPGIELTADRAAGVAPLVVVFALNGTDPEGQPLTWMLDIDGDQVAEFEGDSLPASPEYTFDVGTYQVNFTVSDGQASTFALMEIVVTAPEEGGPSNEDLPAPLRWAGSTIGFLGTSGFCLPSTYHYYAPEIIGWTYISTTTNKFTEWWDDNTFVKTEGWTGSVPAGTDNVGVCSTATVASANYVINVYHPDWTF